jgi:hypothetical protein
VIGNALIQAHAVDVIGGDLEALRGLVADRFPVVTYQPNPAGQARQPDHPRPGLAAGPANPKEPQ